MTFTLPPSGMEQMQSGSFVNPNAGQAGFDAADLPAQAALDPRDPRFHIAATVGLLMGDKFQQETPSVTPKDPTAPPDFTAETGTQPTAPQLGITQVEADTMKAPTAALAASPTGAPTGAPTSPTSLIADANKYLGIPYVYGASGAGAKPTSFDCSSFVQRVFADMGIPLPRVTYDQVKMGVPITGQAALQPGDLIFMQGDGNRVNGHVGIYVGNGTMVNAPHSGTTVRYDAVPWGSVTAMRRVT